MNPQQRAKYQKFRNAVLERLGTLITTNELYILINRYTYSDKKRYFGYSRGSRFDSRLNYHRYFIKMLVGEGILIETEKFGIWRVKSHERTN